MGNEPFRDTHERARNPVFGMILRRALRCHRLQTEALSRWPPSSVSGGSVFGVLLGAMVPGWEELFPPSVIRERATAEGRARGVSEGVRLTV